MTLASHPLTLAETVVMCHPQYNSGLLVSGQLWSGAIYNFLKRWTVVTDPNGTGMFLSYGFLIPLMLFYVIVSRYVVNAAVMISTYIIPHHFSSSWFHKFIVSPPPLPFLPYSGPGKFSMTFASPQRETHDSSFCLNGLPSTQLLFVCIKLFDFVTFFPIIY